MDFLMSNIRIYSGENSRGEYHWMRAQIHLLTINETTHQEELADAGRNAVYHNFWSQERIKKYLEQTEALSVNEGGWVDVDVEKLPEPLQKVRNLDLITKPLDDWYRPIYYRDFTDPRTGKTYKKGDFRVGTNGDIRPAVNEISFYTEHALTYKFVNGEKKLCYVPAEDPNLTLQNILDTFYRRDVKPVKAAPTSFAEEDLDDGAPANTNDEEEKLKKLQDLINKK